jgi:hypothetical protein
MSATADVKGGFWAQYAATLSQVSGINFARREAAKMLNKKGTYALRELMETLNGAAAGSAASKTLGRIEANSELGGVRVVETETLVGRNTASADETAIDHDILAFSANTYTASPVANGDGNPLGTR